MPRHKLITSKSRNSCTQYRTVTLHRCRDSTYIFDNRNNAEIPKIPAVATTAAAPPTGRTATNGPSQVLGSFNAVWLAARVMLAFLHDAAYPPRTACDPTLKSIFLLTSMTFVNMHCSQLRSAETVSALHRQAASSLQDWMDEIAVEQVVAQAVLTSLSGTSRICEVVRFCFPTVTLKATTSRPSGRCA